MLINLDLTLPCFMLGLKHEKEIVFTARNNKLEVTIKNVTDSFSKNFLFDFDNKFLSKERIDSNLRNFFMGIKGHECVVFSECSGTYNFYFIPEDVTEKAKIVSIFVGKKNSSVNFVQDVLRTESVVLKTGDIDHGFKSIKNVFYPTGAYSRRNYTDIEKVSTQKTRHFVDGGVSTIKNMYPERIDQRLISAISESYEKILVDKSNSCYSVISNESLPLYLGYNVDEIRTFLFNYSRLAVVSYTTSRNFKIFLSRYYRGREYQNSFSLERPSNFLVLDTLRGTIYSFRKKEVFKKYF